MLTRDAVNQARREGGGGGGGGDGCLRIPHKPWKSAYCEEKNYQYKSISK